MELVETRIYTEKHKPRCITSRRYSLTLQRMPFLAPKYWLPHVYTKMKVSNAIGKGTIPGYTIHALKHCMRMVYAIRRQLTSVYNMHRLNPGRCRV